MTLTDRITHHLLMRLRRAAIHDLYDRVAESGLIESAFIDQSNEKGLVWRVPAGTTVPLSGDADADDRIIRRALRLRSDGASSGVTSTGTTRDYDGARLVAKGSWKAEAYQQFAAGDATFRPGQGAILSDQVAVLRIIRQYLPPLPVADVAVALLLARAVGESVPTFEALITVLRKPDPMILIRVPARAFEHRFGVMLEVGLIVPQPLLQVDGFGSNALSGNYRDPGIGRRMITFSGQSIRKRNESALREMLAKARLAHDTPAIIADEVSSELSPRFAATADLVLACAGIDRPLIAELLQICAGIAPKVSLAVMERQQLDPAGLGIDDLVLAVRNGRTAEAMIAVLIRLQQENASPEANDDDDADEQRRGSKNGKTKASASVSRKGVSSFDLIEPVPDIVVDALSASTGRDAVRIESLAGYGQARTWALDLQTDLVSWRGAEIIWSDMSTKLLLSGPPGTGKTLFARALCNSLQLPMLATSVAQWLEKAYLGDVLKEMAAVFEAARKASPSILFIDELDNIGRRGGHDQQHSDYWSSLVNRLLELLDGAARTEGVIVVGATNHPAAIDPALLRSGRLETKVDITYPDTPALTGILAHHLGADLSRIVASRSEPRTVIAAKASAFVTPTQMADPDVSGSPSPSDKNIQAGDRP